MYWNIIKMSFQALSQNKLRSTLTALGIILGTAIVIVMLSVGQGVRSLILSQLSDITPETLYVEVQVPSSASATQAERDQNTASSIATGVQITTLSVKDVENLVDHPNIKSGYGMNIGQSKITYRNVEKTVTFFAAQEDYDTMEGLKFETGRFFTESEERGLSQVVVLGSEVKTTLFGNSPGLGKKIKISGQNFEVIGVAKEIGTKFFLPMDELIYLPARTAHKKIMGINHFQAIALIMHDSNLLPGTIRDIQRIMRKNHNIKNPEKDDFVVRTLDESMEIIDVVTNGLTFLLFAIASISLVVGGVGIMNVMYVSVTERTNEIGLKKALGARPFSIKFQFIFEAVFISAIGGVIGVVLGIGISWLVSFIAGLLNFEWPFFMSFQIASFAFQIAVVLGIVFGYAPAKKAATMNPIDALRKA